MLLEAPQRRPVLEEQCAQHLRVGVREEAPAQDAEAERAGDGHLGAVIDGSDGDAAVVLREEASDVDRPGDEVDPARSDEIPPRGSWYYKDLPPE